MNNEQRILAVDYGKVRVGLALSDPTASIASPLCCLNVTSIRDAARKIVKKLEEHEAGLIVVGLPLMLDGTEGLAAEAVRELIEQISRRTNKPIETWDERFSTRGAERTLREGGLSAKQQRGRLDPIAASLILQAYLDGRS